MQIPRQSVVYTTFILRFWPEAQSRGDPAYTWRFSLEDPGSGVRRGFHDLESLACFLESQLQVAVKGKTKKY